MERETRRLEGLGQLGFDFRTAEESAGQVQQRAGEDDLFLDPEPHELFVGSQRLDDYLREAGLGRAPRLSALLAELDLTV